MAISEPFYLLQLCILVMKFLWVHFHGGFPAGDFIKHFSREETSMTCDSTVELRYTGQVGG